MNKNWKFKNGKWYHFAQTSEGRYIDGKLQEPRICSNCGEETCLCEEIKKVLDNE